MAVVSEICETLGIPASYLKLRNLRFVEICLVNKEWLSKLISEKEIPTFTTHEVYNEDEVQELIQVSGPEEFGEVWSYISLKIVPKNEKQPCLSSRSAFVFNESLLYSQLLHFVNQSNFSNLWAFCFKNLKNAHIPISSENRPQLQVGGNNEMMLDMLLRLYNCDFISTSRNHIHIDYEESQSHLIKGYCIIESASYYIVLLPYKEFSLYDSVMYSPALLLNNDTKQLFIFYQILQAVLETHSRGLYFGNIKLSNLKIDSKLWLEIDSDLDNCFSSNVSSDELDNSQEIKNKELKVLSEMPIENTEMEMYEKYLSKHVCDILLSKCKKTEEEIVVGELVSQWVMNAITNFDYLLALNYISGRKFKDPRNYPILPWVIDFSYPDKGWRDLSKSKYRLNKGDKQLDVTYDVPNQSDKEEFYNASHAQVPHHVTDFLSEITYYVYKARRIPQSILRKYVRNVWVPAEYPSSVFRLQKWTPEECIPEFYCDPLIFKSIHSDLPDLEVPWWSSSPEDFIIKHRIALESPSVSERLHNWIDLVFGHKLTGTSAVKAKNVCLHLADNHVKLMKAGIVQLFVQPHPQKLMPNNYFSILPPRLKIRDETHRACLDPDAESMHNGDFQEEMKNSRMKCIVANDEKLVELGDEKCSVILPRDYSPNILLSNLESLNQFLKKMCCQYKNNLPIMDRGRESFSHNSHYDMKLAEDTVVVGCLFIELVLFNKIITSVRINDHTNRVNFARKVLQEHHASLPRWLQVTLDMLLNPFKCKAQSGNQSSLGCQLKECHSCISNRGLPPPSAYQLLQNSLSLIPFPPYFSRLHSLISLLVDYSKLKENILCGILPATMECQDDVLTKLDEMKILCLARELQDLLPCLSEEGLEIITPYIKELFEDKDTSILAAWYLFDIVGRAFGRKRTTSLFLLPLVQIFDNDSNTGKPSKLYHRSFLIQIVIHFGLDKFLLHFPPLLVEGVGGYKDSRSSSTSGRTLKSQHPHLGSPELEVIIMSPTIDDDSSQADSVKETRMTGESVDQSARLISTQSIEKDLDSQGYLKEPEIFPFEEGDCSDSRQWSIDPSGCLEDIKEIERMTKSTNDDATKFPCLLPDDCDGIDSATIEPETNSILSNSVPAHLSWSEGLHIPASPNIHSHPASPISRSQQAIYDHHKRGSVESSPQTCSVSEVCAESVCWLAHRLGPVLTAKHLSRNLLKMLTLCYYGESMLELGNSSLNDLPKISSKVIVGDQCCSKVLMCLSNIAGLYGENFILLQYFSHCIELVASCKKKLTVNLEAGLLGCMSLLYHIVPYLCDVSIMDCLQDKLINQILYPTLKLISSRRIKFPGGHIVRSLLVYRLLDVLYLVACRIGSEMTKLHLSHILTKFFSSFDRVVNNSDKIVEKGGDAGTSCSVDSSSLTNNGNWKEVEEKRMLIMQELLEVYTPNLAYSAYVPFCHLAGIVFMESNLKNETLIRELCLQYEQSIGHSSGNKVTPMQTIMLHPSENAVWQHDFKAHSYSEPKSDVQVVGNRIDFQINEGNSNSIKQTDNLKKEIYSVSLTKKMENTARHLKGNWMLYWEHEIGCPDMDTQFNFKQIKLQSYVGHSNSIKALKVIDNENSFISCSKDKSVKLWSIRSQGDGSTQSSCQWTYSEHRKSVFNVIFIEASRLVASCDSSIHIWDPFMGSKVGIIDSTKTSPITVIQSTPSPSKCFFAATTDGSVKIIDIRKSGQLNEIKVSPTPAGFIRALSVSPDGLTLSVGHSSGLLSCLDIRTGMLLSSWKAHEGEILQVCSHNDKVISSSLDQSIGVWNIADGKLFYHIKEPLEPVHCLLLYQNQLVSGTTANRIGIHSPISTNGGDIHFTSTKLRSDTFKGVLTSLAILPLNKLFLTGADNGAIKLLC